WQKKVLKMGDVIFKHAQETDIVIPIIGPAGTGKSTLINHLLGRNDAAVGHHFTSGTAQIQHFIVDIPSNFYSLQGRRLILVDTPGFDDIHITDEEILRRIGAWLAHSYANNMTIGGIVYLQDISQSRLPPSSKRNVEIFRRLCGSDALSSVIIATGKWDLLKDENEGLVREKQLQETLWTEVISAGASVRRFKGTHESAWKIISTVLDKVENTNQANFLTIQKELVDLLRKIPETGAGKALSQKIRSLRTIQRQRVEEHEGPDVSEDTKLKNINEQLKALEIPLSRRLQIFFGITVRF
ncbi:P-loop containing nucleoside triphosphate hydrolase protein, partial [Phlegmacium glaucopus]